MATYRNNKSAIRTTSGSAINQNHSSYRDDEYEDGTARHVINDYDEDAHKSKKNRVLMTDIISDMSRNGYQNPELSPLTDSMSSRLDYVNGLNEQKRYKQYLMQQAINPAVANKYDLATAQEIQSNAYGQLDDSLKSRLTEINDAKYPTYIDPNTGVESHIPQMDEEDSGLQNLNPLILVKNVKKTLSKGYEAEDSLKDDYGLSSYDVRTLESLNQQDTASRKKQNDIDAMERQYNLPDDYYESKAAADEEERKKNGTRTYSEEIEYANNYLTGISNNTDLLREDMARYNSANQSAYVAGAESGLEQMSGASGSADYMRYQADKIKKELRDKYRLTDDQFERAAQYSKELDNYDKRIKQQQDAYNNVHTDSADGNIIGGVKNSAISLANHLVGGVGGTLAAVNYYSGNGGYDKQSALDPNQQAFTWSNRDTDYMSATSSVLDENSHLASFAYGAGMSALQSMETNVLGGALGSAASALGASANVIGAAQKIGSLAPFAASAFSSSLNQNVLNDQQMDEALGNALISAGIETGTEIWSVDKFWDLAKKNSRVARNVMINYLASSGIEGIEEVTGDVAELIVDRIRHGDNSEFDQTVKDYINDGYSEEDAWSKAALEWIKQTALDGAAGMLSGALGGVGATTIGRMGATTNANKMFDGFTQQDYADIAADIDSGEIMSNGLRKRSAESSITTDEDGIGYGDLKDLTYGDVDETNTEDPDIRFPDNTRKNARQETAEHTEQPSGGDDSIEFGDTADLTKGDNAEEVDTEVKQRYAFLNQSAHRSAEKARALAEKYSNQETVTDKEKRELYYALNDMWDTEAQAQHDRAEKSYDAAVKALQDAAEYNQHESAVDDYEARNGGITSDVAMQDIDLPENLQIKENDSTAGQIHKRMANAKTAAELESAVTDGLHSTDYNTRVQTLRNLENLTPMLESRGITEEQISSIRMTDSEVHNAGYQGNEISGLSNRQQQIYNIGAQSAIEARTENNNRQRSEMVRNATSIRTEAERTIYENGYQSGMNATLYDRVLKTMSAAARNGVSESDAVGQVQDYLEMVGGDQKQLKETLGKVYANAVVTAIADANYETARAISEQQSVERFGKGTFTDARGEADRGRKIDGIGTLEAVAKITGLDIMLVDDNTAIGNSQGSFVVQNSTIYLNAGKASRIASTLYHELGEFTSVYSPEEFQGFVKAVNSMMLNKLGAARYNEIREDYLRRYAKESGKTDADLDKEIACDMLYQFLGSKEGMSKLIDSIDANNSVKEATTIKQKLADWISKLSQSLKELFAEFKPSASQQKIADAQIAQCEELAEMLNQSIAKAVDNYRQAQLSALAETLEINENPNTVVESVTTQQDAYQIAYNNFANTVDRIAVAQDQDTDVVSDDLAATFVDVSRAFRQSVANEKKSVIDDVLEVIHSVCLDLFQNEQQCNIVYHMLDNYSPVYDGVGTHNIPHDDSIMGEYIYSGDRKPVDGYIALGNLIGAINKYEQKFGIADDTVRGYLDDAKKAVNGIQEAMNNGYSSADGKTSGVTSAEAEYFKKAMKALEKYSLEHVDGFKKGDINNRSTSASIRNINIWMSWRERLNRSETTDEELDDPLDTWDGANARNSEEEHEPVEIFEMSANEFNANVHKAHRMESQGKVAFLDYTGIEGIGRDTQEKFVERAKDWGAINSAALGRIEEVSFNTIRDFIRHNTPAIMYSQFDATKIVLEKGIPVAADVNHKGVNKKGKGYNTVTLVAPVTFTGKGYGRDVAGEYYAAVSVKRTFSSRGVNQSIHVLDVYTVKKDGSRAVPVDLDGRSEANHLSLRTILRAVDEDVNLYQESNVKHRFSIGEEDSNGAPLTDGQREYFGDSKAVDDDGRLKVMYHGTTNANFTVFNPAFSDDGISLFFTDSINTASTYSDTRDVFAPDVDEEAYKSTNSIDAVNMNYCVYLNLKNPMVVDYEGRYWNDGELRNRKDVVRIAKIANDALSNKEAGSSLERYIDEWISYDNRNHDFETYVESTGVLAAMSAKGRDAVHTISDMLENQFFQMVTDGAVGADVTDMLFDGMIQYNTRDYVREAKDKGYDGVIFKNIIDEGDMGEWSGLPSTVMVAFASNQVKSVNNHNPTEDIDIRRSMDLEDNRNMNNEDISANRDEVAGSLEEVAGALKGTKVNKMAARNIAMEMKRRYNSAYDLEQFTRNLTRLFGYLHSGKSINYNDFVAVMQDVARPVIDAAYTSQASREDYAQFRNGINELSFSLTAEQRKAIRNAFGSMKAFERYYPEIHITEDGKSFAQQWDVLVNMSGGLLDEFVEESDMPTALVDAMEALRPSANTWEDNTEAAHDMALDIIGKYLANYHDDGANKAVINEFVQSAEKEIKAAHKEWKAKAKANYEERLKAERTYQKEIAGNARKKAKARKEDQIARLRAKNATRISNIRERQRRQAQLQQINKTAGTMYQYLTHPTDQNHVPADCEEMVLEIMASLDMSTPEIRQDKDGKWTVTILYNRQEVKSTGQNNPTGKYKYDKRKIKADTREEAIRQYYESLDEGVGKKKWYDRMKTISDMYDKAKDNESFERMSGDLADFVQALDSELIGEYKRVLENGSRAGVATISELNSDDLKVINNMLKNVLKAVNMVNKSYTLASTEISEISGSVIDKADRVNGRRNRDRDREGFIDFMMLDNATPETYMHGIGADKITDIMIAAQNQKAWRIREANEYSNNLFKGFKPKEIENWDKPQSYMNGSITATKAQIMTIYELLKRADAREHLLLGGIKFGAIGNKTNTQNRVIHLTEEQYNALIDEALTDKEKAVADGMQQFMAVNCSSWGNETSMKLYGYLKFLDDTYWPMTVDKTSVNANMSEMMGGIANTIKNMGMTKATISGANNALIINGALDVYAKHVSDMAVYSSWAAPMQDMIRFFNYKEVIENKNGGIDRRSTQDAIERMFGTGGTEYFKNLVASINGTEQSSYLDPGWITKLTSATKKAAVLGNVRVMVQQPTAIVRAATMINPKYLVFGSAYKAAPYYKEAAELRDRSSAVFWLKNQGNIDGQITQSFKSQVTGVQSFGDSFAEKTGALAGKVDEITWAAMYRAVYAEQVDKLGKDKIGTKEFEDAVNSRFDHVMLRTQVYDGTITRSQFMRSTDKLNVLQSAFMAEPVKTYNVVLRDVIDFQQSKRGSQERKDAAKAIAKDITVLYMTAAVNAFAQSLWDGFRNAGDPDEEDGYWARVWDAFFGWDGNLVDNMKPWNWVPVIGDWTDTFIAGVQQVITGKKQWSSSSDLTTSGVGHVYDAATAVVKYARAMFDPEARDKNEQTLYGVLSSINRAASDVTGMPIYAIQRDTAAIYNVFARNVVPLFGGDQLPLLYKSKTSDKKRTRNDVYDTIKTSSDLDEVKAAIDEAANHSNSYKTINDGMKENLKEDLAAAYKESPSEAAKMINRIAEMKAYCGDQYDTPKDKTHSERVEYYKKKVKEWLE